MDSKKYTRAMLDKTARFLDSKSLTHPKSPMVKVWTNHLFNLPGPRITKLDASFFGKIFNGFNEVFESYERLKDFTVYVERYPYNGTRVSPFRHLSHTVSNYYEEFYILHLRLLSYLTLIKKYSLRRLQDTGIKEHFDRLKQMILRVTKGVIAFRGSHVHELRFLDDDLKRLRTLELLIWEGRIRRLRSYYRLELNRARTKWSRTIQQNNREIEELLNVYFTILHLFVFGPRLSLIDEAIDVRTNKHGKK